MCSVRTNGPRPAMVSSGLAAVHSPANLPASRAAAEFVPGQNRQVVQQPQSRRERDRELDHHRRSIGSGDLQRLPASFQRRLQRALHSVVVRRLKREQHIVGRERHAVGKERLAQLECERQAVGGGRPALCEPGLEIVRRAIHPDEARLGEESHQVGGRPALDVAVVRRGIGAHRRDQLSPTRDPVRVARFRRPRAAPVRPPDANDDNCEREDDDQRPENPGH